MPSACSSPGSLHSRDSGLIPAWANRPDLPRPPGPRLNPRDVKTITRYLYDLGHRTASQSRARFSV